MELTLNRDTLSIDRKEVLYTGNYGVYKISIILGEEYDEMDVYLLFTNGEDSVRVKVARANEVILDPDAPNDDDDFLIDDEFGIDPLNGTLHPDDPIDIVEVPIVEPEEEVISVDIPHQCLHNVGTITIGAYGEYRANGVLTERYSTNIITLNVKKGTYVENRTLLTSIF